MLTTRVSYNAEVQLSLYVRKYFRISYVLRKYHTFVLLEHNTLVYTFVLYIIVVRYMNIKIIPSFVVCSLCITLYVKTSCALNVYTYGSTCTCSCTSVLPYFRTIFRNTPPRRAHSLLPTDGRPKPEALIRKCRST